MSYTLFMALPLPLKILLLVGGGFMWFGVRGVPVKEAQAEEPPMRAMPAAPAAVPPEPAKVAKAALVIAVNSDGSFTLNGEKLTDLQVQKKLKAIAAAQPDRSIVLKADALTPHQMVVSGLKLCKEAGVKNVSFATKPAAP